MEIRQYIWDIVDANSWLIMEGNDGLLIDAVENQELYKTVSNLSTLMIILTHSHFDHIIGLNRIRDTQPKSIVIATKRCSDNIGNIYRNMSSSADAFLAFYQQGKKSQIHIEPFSCFPVDRVFDNELSVNWYGHNIRLLSMYGHSNDGLITIVDDKYIFSGDTLLSIPTTTRLPSGNTKRFREEDIPQLMNEHAEIVYPGHGAAGKLTEMLAINKKR